MWTKYRWGITYIHMTFFLLNFKFQSEDPTDILLSWLTTFKTLHEYIYRIYIYPVCIILTGLSLHCLWKSNKEERPLPCSWQLLKDSQFKIKKTSRSMEILKEWFRIVPLYVHVVSFACQDTSLHGDRKRGRLIWLWLDWRSLTLYTHTCSKVTIMICILIDIKD